MTSAALVLRLRRSGQLPVLAAALCTLVLLLAGSLYSSNFLSADYLLLQLQIASFLGVVATGAMLVILLGGIDLSVPWVVTVGGLMSAASAGWWGGAVADFAIPIGIACGALLGLVNGIGVAYLRVPSMIFTLGVNAVAQGLIVVHTGGFAPQDRATPVMHLIATGRSVLGMPNALLVWIAVGAATLFLLHCTTLGRAIYAVGNRERAAYLSGIDTRRVTLLCFVMAGACSAAAGVLLTGYATKAYQAMGDSYLLPAIAAVVLGGTHILGGRGSYLGTVVGVVLITLLQSILSVMQIPEMGRQVIYGTVIIVMLLLYGRGRPHSE
ncbi:MAG: ABC transporter permease [Bacteriovorax sp.]|nr:ABC transporter permease [Rhizobacter sp.]